MTLNPLENLVFSLFDLLKGSIIVAIPVFVLILIGQRFRKNIAKQTKWSWFSSAFAATFVMMFILTLIAYFLPFLIANQELSLGVIPSSFAPSLDNILLSFIVGVIKVAIVAVVISILLMPLEFMGLYFHEVVSKKLEKSPEWLKLLITAYVSSVFSSAIIIFLVPETIPGLLYFLYFGF